MELTDPVVAFTEHRALLFTIAYEITGSAVDAEDVVSECFVRWNAAGSGEGVRNPRAYLARIATHQALNLLRAKTRRREEYVGAWLPEPLLTAPDVAEDAVMSEAISMAMMVVLESLSPDERAVFVLREVFGFDFREIGAATGRSEAAARQIAHRARGAVQARRPRFEPDAALATAALEKFWAATATGDVQGLMSVLAPDVVVLSDGGGKAKAALRPVVGSDAVARFMIGLARKNQGMDIRPALINGAVGVQVTLDGALDSVATVDLVAGRIARIYFVRNPDKLAAAWTVNQLAR